MSIASKSAESKIYIPSDQTRISTRKKILAWQDIKCYTQSRGKCDWRKVISQSHWKPGKSAFKTASAWEECNRDLPPEIKALFKEPAELLIATPEHRTPLRGRGRASQTDVLAFVCAGKKLYAVAVEGKVEEPFGNHNVREWLDAGENRCNREKRLEHILGELGLSRQCVMDLRYQLLHRAACAVIEAERFNAKHAAMIVHSFSKNKTGLCEFERFVCAFKIECTTQEGLYKTKESSVPLFLGWANSKCSR